MGGPTEDAAKQPRQIMATLLLERQMPIDYNLMIERVGSTLGIDAANIGDSTPGAPMVLPVDGDIVFGLNMDLPYPDTLQQQARFAYWWPNALSDLARHKAHQGAAYPFVPAGRQRFRLLDRAHRTTDGAQAQGIFQQLLRLKHQTVTVRRVQS